MLSMNGGLQISYPPAFQEFLNIVCSNVPRVLMFFYSNSIAKFNLIQIIVHFLNAILSSPQIKILSYQIFQQNVCNFLS